VIVLKLTATILALYSFIEAVCKCYAALVNMSVFHGRKLTGGRHL